MSDAHLKTGRREPCEVIDFDVALLDACSPELRADLLAEARLLGLVVSPHSVSSFLGYERTGLRQPWPLPAMLRWRHRGSFLVLWEDIAVIGAEAVRLREGFTAYAPELDGSGQE